MFYLPFDTLKVTFSQRYTDGPTDRRTDGQTTILLELLRAAKKHTSLVALQAGTQKFVIRCLQNSRSLTAITIFSG